MKTYNCFLGIDISKNSFNIALLKKTSNEFLENEKFKMNKQGFNKLIKLLNKHSEIKNSIFIAMESTGSYHINILNFLVNKGYDTALVNPQLINSFSKAISLRNSETDSIAANNIAQFAKTRYDSLELVDKNSIVSLKPLIREREDILKSITRIKNKTRNLIDRVFPELSKVTNLFSNTIIKLLKQAPSANKVTKKGLDFVENCINDTNGSKIKASAKQIFEAAKNSTGLTDENLEKIILLKLRELTLLQESLTEIENTINASIAHNEKIKKNAELLKSIKGINDKTAIPFLIESGILGTNVKNVFSSHKQLIAYTGTDPSIKQSGTSINRRGGISKKGNSYLRKIVYTMAKNVSRYTDYFKAYLNKKRNEGKEYNQAIIAVANKLLKVIYALLKNRTKYDSKYHLNQVNWIA